MKPRIAIPEAHSRDTEYNERSWPLYAQAVERAGGEVVRVPLRLTQSAAAQLVSSCSGILLPGSCADLSPQKYGQQADPATAAADPAREAIDEILIQDAHNMHKPLFCICFGSQSLNVWRGGTLVQDLQVLPVNHRAGRSVAVAHTAAIVPGSLLASLVDASEAPLVDGFLRLPVNSSHHQAIGIAGDNLRVVARCPQDAVVEAVEGPSAAGSGEPGHYVLAVQWHPERTYDTSPTSRALFARLVQEAAHWRPRAIHTSVATPQA
ncbi:MAG: gamma-glutamyl-gamma-aminobutyrate hydrolase family protein [Acidobacteriota bacterium]|nr:gamma-glutamyl-gamma-aminobutyrate hydrolase family protein [Acidobacteriota bacterium]